MNRVESIPPAELARRLAQGEALVLLDVREPFELAIARLEGARSIPLGELARRLGELDPEAPTVCVCHHGVRSAQACGLLARAGFRSVLNLAGGVDRWSREVDPGLPRY